MAEDQQVSVPWLDQPISFPADMTKDEINTALLRNYGPQMRAYRNPEDISAGMGLRGILGGYVPQAEAAIRAATGQGQGETFSERYANLVPEREAQYARAEREQPILSGALQAAGGTAALAPVGATATGAKLLGMTGGLLSRAAYGGASGAALSAADAALRGQDPETAAYLGGGIGAAAAPVTGAIGRAISPLYSQLARNVDRSYWANKLRQAGVEVTAGQESGSPTIRWSESALGGLTDEKMIEQQQKQFTRAALARAGIDADSIEPKVLNKAFDDIGKRYDDAASKTAIYGGGLSPAGTTGQGNLVMLGNELEQIVRDYKTLAQLPAGTMSAPESFLARVVDAAVNGRGIIRGDAYQSITSDLQRLARRTADPSQKMALLDMRSALNDAMERGAAGTPYEKIWQQLNRQYRNLLTIEKAAGGAGEMTALQGSITPARLTQAIGGRAYARDRSDLAELARAGNALLKPLPQSGTAPRTFFMSTVPHAIGGAAAGGYGLLQGQDPSTAAFGGLAGVGATYGMGRLLNQPWFQAYLRNQILQRAPQLPSMAAPLAGVIQQ